MIWKPVIKDIASCPIMHIPINQIPLKAAIPDFHFEKAEILAVMWQAHARGFPSFQDGRNMMQRMFLE